MTNPPPPQPFSGPRARTTFAEEVHHLANRREEAKVLEWDRHWMRIAQVYSFQSKDPSTKVGCLLAKGKEWVSAGYNGLPKNIEDDPSKLADRQWRLDRTVHAELNALLRAGYMARGATLFLYGFASPPCVENCCKHVIAAGIERVVSCNETEDVPERWREQFEKSAEMLYSAGVTYYNLPFKELAIHDRIA